MKNSNHRKRRFQYTVRSLLVALLASAVALSVPAWRRAQYWAQWRAVQRLRELRVEVDVEPKEGAWAQWFVGKDAYCTVRTIAFRDQNVTREMMRCFGRFLNITQIVMNDCVVEDEDDFSEIEDFTNVASVYFSNTNISDRGLRFFAGFVNMYELKIENADISSDGLAYLAGMKKLEELSVTRCKKMTDAGLCHLQAIGSLRSLELSDVPIGEKSVAVLKRLTQVEAFKLYFNDVPPNVIPVLKRSLGDSLML